MFRMGRNSKSDQAGNEATTDPAAPAATQPSASLYTTPPYSNGNASSPTTHAQPTASPRASSESESMARDIKEGNLSGFVGSGTALTGEVTFRAMLRVDGHFSGRINSEDGTLIVSAGGQIDADIEVAIAQINGTINGDVYATKRVELGRAARVNGNIQSPALVVEQGAIFEGVCRMLQIREAQEKQREEQARASIVMTIEEVDPPAELSRVAEIAS